MNSQRKLRSHTIIPESLYIARAADAQLRRIIQDMDRPGYVLVARQMGKTNLLLNAKRTLENESNKFLYMDVSNTFPEIRQFLRNIIDLTLSAYSSELESVSLNISLRREKTVGLPAHKEHEEELRQVLTKIPGTLTICLDEVDALTRVPYTDEVFSFIRSIYFSGRTNFPEFKRLTYVLSGVAEPSELIKNKAVSPFNIGEKIFLDDFSLGELRSLFLRADLPFDDEVCEQVFAWSNGNPRISWDIASALEEAHIKGERITRELLDNLVHRLYLTNFDKPPIDHIRTLVEEDKVIRDAVMSMHYGKADTISDATKRRLYLAGITRAEEASGKRIAIKNRILLESLTEEWIHSVEKRGLPLLEFANAEYNKDRFSSALQSYREYLASTSSSDDPDLYRRVSDCLFHLKQYEEAIEFLDQATYDKAEMPQGFYYVQYRKALANLLLDRIQESIDGFRVVLEQDANQGALFLYFDACINLSAALLSDPEKHREEIFDATSRILDANERLVSVSGEENARQLKCLAYYHRATAERKRGSILLAKENLDKSIELALADQWPFLMLESIELDQSTNVKREKIERCVSHILKTKPVVVPDNKETVLVFSESVCSRIITQLVNLSCFDRLTEFGKFLSAQENKHEVVFGVSLFNAFIEYVMNGNGPVAAKLINHFPEITSEQFPDSDSYRLCLCLGLLVTPFDMATTIGERYTEEFLSGTDAKLAGFDVRLTHQIVRRYLTEGRLAEARRAIDRFNSLFSGFKVAQPKSIVDAAEAIAISWDVDISILEHDESALDKVEWVLAKLKAPDLAPPEYFSATDIKQLGVRMRGLIAALNKLPVLRERSKIGRNQHVRVRFDDGSIEEGKYKRFQDRLEQGLCTLLE